LIAAKAREIVTLSGERVKPQEIAKQLGISRFGLSRLGRELQRRRCGKNPSSPVTALIESYSMLFLAVLLGVRLRCLLSVPMGVKLVGARCEGMM
jgi:hypothetical protein